MERLPGVAIGFAFLLSLLSPGGRAFELLIGAPVLHILTAGQRGTVMAMVNYWLPAVLIYLALRLISQAARLRPTPKEAIALRVANTVLVIYVVARIFASTIEGGGAGYTVAGLAVVTSLPALVVVGIVLAKVTVRALSAEPVAPAFADQGPGEVAAVASAGLVPIAIVSGILLLGADAPLQSARGMEARWDELCAGAGETFVRIPQGVEGVYFANNVSTRFEKLGPGEFMDSGSGTGLAESLLHGRWLRYYEMSAYARGSSDPATVHYERIMLTDETGAQSAALPEVVVTALPRAERIEDVPPTPEDKRDPPARKQEPVDTLMSQFGFYLRELGTDEDQKHRILVVAMEVKELSSGNVIATSTYFRNSVNGRICGDKSVDNIRSYDFLRRALNLNRQFEVPLP